jgi:hypothetical protein
MARATYSEVESMVRQWLCDEEVGNYETSSIKIKSFIWQAFIHLLNVLELQEQGYGILTGTVASVANQEYYELPDDCIVIDYLAAEDDEGVNREIEPKTTQELDRMIEQNMLPESGTAYYAFEGNYIRLRPVIAATGRTITIRYAAVPAEPGETNPEISLPLNFKSLLALRTAIMIMESNQDDTSSLRSIHDDVYDICIRLASKRQRQKQPRMKSKWELYRSKSRDIGINPSITRRY